MQLLLLADLEPAMLALSACQAGLSGGVVPALDTTAAAVHGFGLLLSCMPVMLLACMGCVSSSLFSMSCVLSVCIHVEACCGSVSVCRCVVLGVCCLLRHVRSAVCMPACFLSVLPACLQLCMPCSASACCAGLGCGADSQSTVHKLMQVQCLCWVACVRCSASAIASAWSCSTWNMLGFVLLGGIASQHACSGRCMSMTSAPLCAGLRWRTAT